MTAQTEGRSRLDSRSRSRVAVIVMLCALLALQVIRLFFSVDIEDESYYFTNVIRMLQGDVLFGDIWDSTQTSAIVLLPFYWIYSKLFGFTGLILFGRFLSLAFRLLVFAVCYLGIAPYLSRRARAVSLFALVIYAPFSLYTVCYNNFGFLFCILGFGFFLLALSRKRRVTRRLCLCAAGIAHAFMVSSYPSMLFILPLLVVCLFVIAKLEGSAPTRLAFGALLWYLIGACCVLIPFLIFLACGPGFSSASLAISQILGAPFSAVNNDFDRWTASAMDLRAMLGRKTAILFLFIFCALFIVMCFSLRKPGLRKRCRDLTLCAYGLWVLAVLYLVMSVDYWVMTSQNIVFFLVLPLPLLFLCVMEKGYRRRAVILLFTFALPSLLTTLMVSLTSGGAFKQGKYALFGVLIYCIICLFWIAQIRSLEAGRGSGRFHLPSSVSRGLALVLGIGICSLLLFAQYAHPYYDDALSNETRLLTTGPGAGLHSASWKANRLEYEYADLNDVADRYLQGENGTLLVIENEPYTYGVCEKLSPGAPSTWLVSGRLGWGTHDYYWTNLFEYYDTYPDKVPDIIFMDDSNLTPEFMAMPGDEAEPDGVFDLKYSIHDYLLEHYNCVIERDSYSIWVRNEDPA